MKKILLPFYILILSQTSFGQVPDLSELEDYLESSDITQQISSSLGGNANSEDYQGSTLNSYSNTIQQLSKVERQVEEDMLFSQLQKERLKLAIELCYQDEKACFLIDKYRDFANQSSISLDPKDLTLFGTDLFSGFSLDESLVEELPIQDDYVIKIGDVLGVLVVGQQNIFENIKVSPDGFLNVKNIGRISVAGLSLEDANSLFKKFVNDKFLGSEATIYAYQLSANRVFAMGAVKKPNAFTLNARGSLINLIIAAGGFNKNSSLRNIKIVNDGMEKSIDLYDLLISGQNIDNLNLKSGDSLLISAAENIITVSGEVNRPSKFEILEGETIEDALEFALGFSPIADRSNIVLKRRDKNGRLIARNIRENDFQQVLKRGDEIVINKLNEETSNTIELIGALLRPGIRQFEQDLNFGSLIDISQDLLLETYTGFGIIERYKSKTRSYEYLLFDLLDQDRLDNLRIVSGDKIFFFSKEDISFFESDLLKIHFLKSPTFASSTKISQSMGKGTLSYEQIYDREADNNNLSLEIGKLDQSRLSCLSDINIYGGTSTYDNLNRKANLFNSTNVNYCPDILNDHPTLLPILLNSAVPVFGALTRPGLYPISDQVNADELVSLAGGKLPGASNIIIEVGKKSGNQNSSEGAMSISFLNAKSANTDSRDNVVKLVGEFKFPGTYVINGTTTLSEIVKRAGGLTKSAYKMGGILTRESVRIRERDALLKAEKELANILASVAMAGIAGKSSQDLLGIYELITSLGKTEPIGRVVANLDPNLASSDPEKDIILESGDILYMPKLPTSVSVVGSVLNPVTLPYNPSFNLNDYIKLAGGYNNNADESRSYVLLPNGRAFKPSTLNFFSRVNGDDSNRIIPGSTIIVPMESRPLSGLALAEVLTPVLANLSITAASINSISQN